MEGKTVYNFFFPSFVIWNFTRITQAWKLEIDLHISRLASQSKLITITKCSNVSRGWSLSFKKFSSSSQVWPGVKEFKPSLNHTVLGLFGSITTPCWGGKRRNRACWTWRKLVGELVVLKKREEKQRQGQSGNHGCIGFNRTITSAYPNRKVSPVRSSNI